MQIVITMLSEINTRSIQKTKIKMQKIENSIRKYIRSNIRNRMPLTFEGLYEDTFETLSGVFELIDRNALKQILISELTQTFPQRLSKADTDKLRKIWGEADRARQKSKFDTINF